MDLINKAKKALKINIIDNFNDNIENYDEQFGDYEGQRVGKIFYRVDSKLLQPMIEEIMSNPQSKYFSYVNKSIKEGLIPQHISCMLKQFKYHEDYTGSVVEDRKIFNKKNILGNVGEVLSIKEALSSQILNYFGCPTVYNSVVKFDDNEHKIISADFSSEGTTFLTFDEYQCRVKGDIAPIVEEVKSKILKKIITVSEEEKNKFLEDFILSYIVRRSVLFDMDFYQCNAGVVIDYDNKKLSFLNFDYEYAFEACSISKNVLKVVKGAHKKYLEFLKHNYPSIYDNFCKKLKILVSILSTMKDNNEINCDETTAKGYVYSELNDNLLRVNDSINELEMIK